MHHLGTWVSALADGQLGPAESERALAHVAACSSCAEQLARARQARRALSVIADVEPAPDLTARLLALATAPQPDPHDAAASRGPRPGPHARRTPVLPLGSSAYSRPARALTGELGARRSPRVRLAAGSAAGFAVVGASLFLLGARPVVVPDAHPAEARTILGGASAPGAATPAAWAPDLAVQLAAATTPTGSGSDAAVLDWMREAGWSSPVGLPDGYEVSGARLVGTDPTVLELDLEGPHGVIVLTEQRGQLQVDSIAGAAELAVGDRTVFVLSRQPWHAVWQAGDTVVSVVADGPTDAATELVTDLPAAGYDDGLPARLTRGWDTVTGAFARP